MSYSRRQLYAMGEPIGDSATRRKADGGLILGDGGGGGGGGQSPVQQQTQISDLPDWAKGYAQDVLAKGQALTSNQYQPYTQQRIAGFNPLQQQAFTGAANLGPTAQTAAASNIAGTAGLGALGQNYQAGQFSGGRFTPMAAQQYMNPYLQSSLAPQIALAQQEQGRQATQMASQATQAGAFGGSRFGIAQGQQNLNNQLALQNLVGQGYNQAYQNAASQFNQDMARRLQAQQLGEQSRQFGANLGLQGLQTGLQAAGTLGTLGQQQFAQQQGAIQAQSAAGATQQAQQQKALDTAYQDYLTQLNYPYQQLSYMSNLIRGTPMGMNTQSQVYQAPGSTLGQVAGLGMGAYGLSKLMAKDGGLMQSYAGGGVTSEENAADIASRLSDDQLQQAYRNALLRHDANAAQAIQSEIAMRQSERSGMAGAFNQLPQQQQEQMMAGGGMVAFAEGGKNKGETYYQDPMGAPSYEPESDLSLAKLFGQDVREGEIYTPGLRGMLFGYNVLPGKAKDTTPEAYARGQASTDAEAGIPLTKPPAPATGPTKPASGLGAAIAAGSAAAQGKSLTGDDLLNEAKKARAFFAEENKGDLEGLQKLVANQQDKAEGIRKRGAYQAIADYGFGLAAQAAKPGQPGMGGIRGLLTSAAAASPTLSASVKETEKLASAAEDNANRLQIEYTKYKVALNKGDTQAAMQHAANVRQLQMGQQHLELQRQQLAQQGAYQQGSLGIQQQGLALRQQAAQAQGLGALARFADVRRKAGLDFDTNQGRRLMMELENQYGKGSEKAKYMYKQSRDAYVMDAVGTARDQRADQSGARSVYDLLGED